MLSKSIKIAIKYMKQIKQEWSKNVRWTYLSVNLFAYIFYLAKVIWILEKATLDYHLQE